MNEHELADAPVSIRLTNQQLERAGALARKVGVRRSVIIRLAVTMGLEALEYIQSPGTLEALVKRGPAMRDRRETSHAADR